MKLKSLNHRIRALASMQKLDKKALRRASKKGEDASRLQDRIRLRKHEITVCHYIKSFFQGKKCSHNIASFLSLHYVNKLIRNCLYECCFGEIVNKLQR
jgi:hypothetical protein